MSAPIIWIVVPLLFAIFLFFFRTNRSLSVYLGGGVSAFLALLALTFKIESVFPLGPLPIEISSTFSVLGRSFIIMDNERFILAFMFAMGAFWIFGSKIAGTNQYFVPNVLAITSLLIAALSVQPFLYAALIIEIAVLISIPIFFQRGQPVKQGILRFLVFQTLAVPFILFSGWGFEAAPASIDSQSTNFNSAILLAIGFGLWLAIFPFHSWLPLLAEDGHPYSAGFIFSMLSTTIFIFFLEFFNNYTWIREQTGLFSIIMILGTVMITLGGLFAAFQESITRLFGYAVMVEIGFSLLALSINQEVGWSSYILVLIPRVISFAICALAISFWKNQNFDMNFQSFKGQIYKIPFSMVGFLAGWLTFCGLPLLPGFPTKLPILLKISETSLGPIIFILGGLFGLFVASFRFLATVFSLSPVSDDQPSEMITQKIFFALGTVVLILMGLLPNYLLIPFLNIINAFKNLN